MRDKDLIDHVQPMTNFCYMLHEIKYCEEYKLSTGVYIIKIPKAFVKGNVEFAEPILYVKEDGDIYLRPDFIAAYVPVFQGRLGKVEINDYPREYYKENTEFQYNEDIETKKR